MPTFSFTEKEWDKVRPSSVKKTGVSEAMRDVLKKVPKELKALADGKACDQAVGLLDELVKTFDSAAGLVKKAKDDKHDAAGKLKTWTAEAEDGRKMIELQKNKLLYADANKGAEAKMNTVLESVESSTKEAASLADKIQKDLKAGKTVDVEAHSKSLQDYRNVLRDAKDATTKKGFIKLVKFVNNFHLTGLDPGKIEIPANVKKIESKLPALEEAADAVGEAMSAAVEAQGDIQGDSAIAKESQKLLDLYKLSHKRIKSLAAEGKKLQANAKKVVATVRSANVTETSKLIAVVSKLHDVVEKYENTVLEEGYRSRNAKGDLQSKLIELTKKDGFDETLNKSFREWRVTLFDAIRLCTMPASAAKKEVDDGVEYLVSIGGTTASQGEALAKQVDKDRRETAGKYGSAVS